MAIITGGSSGIGLAIAKRFSLEGAYVFITGRRQSELDKAATEIATDLTGSGRRFRPRGCGSTVFGRFFSGSPHRYHRRRCRFSLNVGNHTLTVDQFDRTFDTNTHGAFFTVQKPLPLMNDGGSIILIAPAGTNKAALRRSL